MKSIESKLQSIESKLKSIENQLKVSSNQLKVNWKSSEINWKSIESKFKSIEIYSIIFFDNTLIIQDRNLENFHIKEDLKIVKGGGGARH